MKLKTSQLRNQWLIMFAAGAALLLYWASNISGDPIRKDAAQTLRLAINLQSHGIMSEEVRAPYGPSMVREPLPVISTALFVAISESILGRATDPNEYFSGERARLLKLQNLLWLSLLCIAVFTAVRLFTSSPTAALVAVVLVNLPTLQLSIGRYMIDSLYTEAPAAALLASASTLLLVGFFHGRWGAIAAAGVTFGLLALTKAVFVYVFLGILLVLIIAALLRLSRHTVGAGMLKTLVLFLCFAATVLPWLVRNHQELGAFAITQRGGVILYIRAVKDRMTPVEIAGALYYWAPWPVNGVLRRAFGFTYEDLQRGGRLQRLNRSPRADFVADDQAAMVEGRPQDAISYYRRSLAERYRLMQQFEKERHPTPQLMADAALRERAQQMMREQPVRHLLMTALFAWRGAFYTFPALALALMLALRQRQYPLALFTVPALGMILFYALFSHFIRRYSLPAYPIAIVAMVVLGTQWIQRRKAATAHSRVISDQVSGKSDSRPCREMGGGIG